MLDMQSSQLCLPTANILLFSVGDVAFDCCFVHKAVALLVLLSLGRFRKVVEMLYGMRHFDRAALFLEACLQFGAVSQTDDNSE